jgi:hypothetical protein
LSRAPSQVPQELRVVVGELRIGDKRRLKAPKTYPIANVKGVRWYSAAEPPKRRRGSLLRRRSEAPPPPPPGVSLVDTRCELLIVAAVASDANGVGSPRHRRLSLTGAKKSSVVLRLRAQSAAEAGLIIAELRRIAPELAIDEEKPPG